MARVLVVDEEPAIRTSIELTLVRDGHEVTPVESAEGALRSLQTRPCDLVIADVRLPGMTGMELLDRLRREQPRLPVLMTSGFGSVGDAVEAMERGARSYLEKPLDAGQLHAVVERILDPDAEAPVEPVRNEGVPEIIGRSRQMQELLELVERVAPTESTILITGETGTGKELISQAIHALSGRRDRVFCAVNSATFTETLLESELFGHQRGAFTGATTNKKGLFEFADRGTVFLDEVAEMPLSMQAKLLRFLQSGDIRPVGSQHTRSVDVRLVTATNKDLEAEVRAGRFREDLYYRLAVIPLHLPALRERTDDIPLLALHFARLFGERSGKAVEGLTPRALEVLCSYSWPGNVRELENAIERGITLCRGGWIDVEDLPPRLRSTPAVRSDESVESLDAVERVHILRTLEKVNWNRSKAAELLQISTTTLWRRLKEFGVDAGSARSPGLRNGGMERKHGG